MNSAFPWWDKVTYSAGKPHDGHTIDVGPVTVGETYKPSVIPGEQPDWKRMYEDVSAYIDEIGVELDAIARGIETMRQQVIRLKTQAENRIAVIDGTL